MIVRRLGSVGPRALLVVASLLLVLGGLVLQGGSSLQAGDANAATLKTVQVMNGLPETLCDPTQWHWIINQIDTFTDIPPSIRVTFSTGETVTVPLSQTAPTDPTKS